MHLSAHKGKKDKDEDEQDADHSQRSHGHGSLYPLLLHMELPPRLLWVDCNISKAPEEKWDVGYERDK